MNDDAASAPEDGEGPDEAGIGRAENTRMCIVSRRTFDPDALIRFVAAPDGTVVVDLKRRLPGRGAHVEMRRAAVDLAVKRRLFGRALKAEVTTPEALGAQVEVLLRNGVLGFLGMARKAGQLVTGATKVETAIRSGRAIAVLHAGDAAADGLRKLDGARLAAAAGGCEEIPAFRPFSSAELGLAFGGGNVIHAAVLAGEAGAALLKRLRALSGYRGEDGPEAMSATADGPNEGGVASKNEGKLPSAEASGTVGRGIDPAQGTEA